MHDNRGVITNRERAKQIRDFSGIRFGNITPTDIDGLIEYQNKGFIFFEFKVIGKEIETGQRIAIERLIDNLKKKSIAIIAEHDTPINLDIDAANSKAVRYYYNKQWHEIINPLPLIDVITGFIEKL